MWRWGKLSEIFKSGWNRKAGRENKDFKKGGKLGQGVGTFERGLEPLYEPWETRIEKFYYWSNWENPVCPRIFDYTQYHGAVTYDLTSVPVTWHIINGLYVPIVAGAVILQLCIIKLNHQPCTFYPACMIQSK